MANQQKQLQKKTTFNKADRMIIINIQQKIKYKKMKFQRTKSSLIQSFNRRVNSGTLIMNDLMKNKYNEDKNKLNTEYAFRNIINSNDNLLDLQKYNNQEIYNFIISDCIKYKKLMNDIEKLKEESCFLTNYPCRVLASKSCIKMPFQYIYCNIYISRKKKKKKNLDGLLCDCHKQDKICDMFCMNNRLQTDCDSENCVNDKCHNKLLQMDHPNLGLIKTYSKGYGVIAKEHIPKDTSIIEYNGEVINLEEHIKRENVIYKGATNFYAIYINKTTIIDGTKQGNISRYFNHSCLPNMVAHKRMFENELHLLFYAKCDINIGDELTFDYKATIYGKKQKQCLCGSYNCRKFI